MLLRDYKPLQDYKLACFRCGYRSSQNRNWVNGNVLCSKCLEAVDEDYEKAISNEHVYRCEAKRSTRLKELEPPSVDELKLGYIQVLEIVVKSDKSLEGVQDGAVVSLRPSYRDCRLRSTVKGYHARVSHEKGVYRFAVYVPVGSLRQHPSGSFKSIVSLFMSNLFHAGCAITSYEELSLGRIDR